MAYNIRVQYDGGIDSLQNGVKTIRMTDENGEECLYYPEEDNVYIGDKSISYCSQLTLFVEGNAFDYYDETVEYIGRYAFYDNIGLHDVAFPNASYIGNSAFTNDIGLLSASFENVTSIAENAFDGCYANHLYFGAFSMFQGDAPYSSTWLFRGMPKLKTVEFKNLLSVHSEMFRAAYSCLETAIFDNCSRIYPNAFYISSAQQGFTKLKNLSFPKCKDIGIRAFYRAIALEEIFFPECTSIDIQAFGFCTNLINVDLPKCTSIGGGVFNRCTNLINVDLPKCTYIGTAAFTVCTSLESINLPECLTIDWDAFESCTALISVSAPKCKYIYDRAFSNTLLEEIDFPECLSVGWSTFYGCSMITNVNLPKCEVIGADAFYGCVNLTDISIPNCITLSVSAFYGCVNLTRVDLPATKTIREGNPFWRCQNLSAIYLYNEVEFVGSQSTTLGDGTAIAKGYGYIFVPAQFYENYYQRLFGRFTSFFRRFRPF